MPDKAIIQLTPQGQKLHIIQNDCNIGGMSECEEYFTVLGLGKNENNVSIHHSKGSIELDPKDIAKIGTNENIKTIDETIDALVKLLKW